jgi:hypothetical protein
MLKLVTVTLPRAYTYRATADTPELTYGPGTVQVPLALAEKLKVSRHIDDFQEFDGEAPRSTVAAERIVPSQELAPDFPAREYLFMAGHTTYDHVADLSREDLLALPNIGEAKADAILEAIKAVDLPESADAQPTTIRRSVEPAQTDTPRRSNVRRASRLDEGDNAA